MKRFLFVLLALIMCVSTCACGDNGDANDENSTNATSFADSGDVVSENEVYYKIGDTVSTDIVEFTLDDAAFAIALENTTGEGYCAPKEYDREEDQRNPYVAKKGQTFVFYEYTMENLDRTTLQVYVRELASIKYNEIQYEGTNQNKAAYYYDINEYYDQYGKLITEEPYVWHMDIFSSDIMISATEKESHRAYLEVKTEVSDLSDEFTITFNLPTSSGEKESFTYLINAK